MSCWKTPLLCLVFALTLPRPCLSEPQIRGALQLTLPDEVYATPGVETSIYFDNVVLTKTPQAYQFDVKCALGRIEKRRWTVTPTAEDGGVHSLSVVVRSAEGGQLATASTKLRVVAGAADGGREIRLLIVGDSLTHASLYPNELARLLNTPGNPRWRMLGSHKPQRAAEGVVHEGYGGWTWQRFTSHYEANPDGTYRKRSSPFVYLQNDKPDLDVERYLNKECQGQQPDFVIFALGINDCFSAPAGDLKGIDGRIDIMFKQADRLLAAFRRAAPRAELGVCVTTPPNSREAAFEANYKGRYSRWGWKRIQHRLVQRQLERWKGKEQANVHVIPMQLNLDPVNGYPANNGVHPNAVGYKQMGASLYAWLKSRLADKRTNEK